MFGVAYRWANSRKIEAKGVGILTMQRSLHAKYGGMHFTQLAHVREINQFVRTLPEDKRDNLFEVMQELDRNGLIRIENDGSWTDHEGEMHP